MENSTRQSESKVSIYKVVPSAITIIGMCFGLTSIRMSLEGFHELAASLILLAAVADGLDGLAARQLNAVSKFGAELDSLTDFLCFGVAPSILLYCMFTSKLGSFGWGATLVFVAACCLRLARFNAFQQSIANPKMMMGRMLTPVRTPIYPKHILSVFQRLVVRYSCYFPFSLCYLVSRPY